MLIIILVQITSFWSEGTYVKNSICTQIYVLLARDFIIMKVGKLSYPSIMTHESLLTRLVFREKILFFVSINALLFPLFL